MDYFKPDDDSKNVKASEPALKRKIAEQILSKHNAVTNGRRFNAIFATASINDAIDYYEIFQSLQKEYRQNEAEVYKPLNIACVFSPPAEGNTDVKQLQEDLPQEKIDNEKEPDKKKKALTKIIDDYNAQYGMNHTLTEFDLYYQDVQERIKNQKYSNEDYPHYNKIDITIVVDMLLTGFDSKFLNTLYVDKNLKQHGLIQAFSRTNRILNATKPAGNILDFRGQEKEVDEAVKMFSGKENSSDAVKIWLVEGAPVVVQKLDKAVAELKAFMKSQGLECKPEQVSNLKGKIAKNEFINKFKEVQRLEMQLAQYANLKTEEIERIESIMPKDVQRAFRGVYLNLAEDMKEVQVHDDIDSVTSVEQPELELVLFSSVTIDYDYIMELISQYTQADTEKKMSKEELASLLCSTSNMMEERENILSYIESLKPGKSLDVTAIKDGLIQFKAEKNTKEINAIANKYNLETSSLQKFIDEIIRRMIFDGEKLSGLLEPLELSWKDRADKEEELMQDLIPLLKKLANGRTINGLKAYE
jgi:type I restriction enzyme R subunit